MRPSHSFVGGKISLKYSCLILIRIKNELECSAVARAECETGRFHLWLVNEAPRYRLMCVPLIGDKTSVAALTADWGRVTLR